LPKIVAKGISKTISNFPGCVAYAIGCAAYAVGCAAYAVGCSAYAVGCAAYAAGCAAYVRQSENKTNSVQLSWSWDWAWQFALQPPLSRIWLYLFFEEPIDWYSAFLHFFRGFLMPHIVYLYHESICFPSCKLIVLTKQSQTATLTCQGHAGCKYWHWRENHA